jgi:hypothetical protein
MAGTKIDTFTLMPRYVRAMISRNRGGEWRRDLKS